jgi:putative component of toxin-antitoxin plasmid stabilization module
VNYEIVELDGLSGSKTTIYSVIMEGDEHTLFDHFVLENNADYRAELKLIINRIQEIGHRTGARANFFKLDEGRPGDGVCALYDDLDSHLRLYCIRYGNVAIILGGGGSKPHGTRAWQDDQKLTKEAKRMIQVSKDIMKRLETGDLEWSPDGTQLLGNLKFSENEE